MELNYKSIEILIIGIFLWITYIYDHDMSRYGIYTIFSFNNHEIISNIPFISLIVTTIWLVYLVRKSIKEKNIKSNKVLAAIFLVLFVVQIRYINYLNNTVTISTFVSIEKINRDKMEVIINEDSNKVTLDCPMIVLDMLKADGTKYGIQYEWNKKVPNYGKLCNVQAVN